MPLKKIFICSAAAALVILIPVSINKYIVARTEAFIFHEADDIPRAEVLLVPGAAVYRKGLSPVLYDRLCSAFDLYRTKKARKILLTGDHGTKSYDEVNAMKKFLLKRGVDPGDIFLDHAGFDTYSSLVRAREIFLVKDAIIVSQRYHLPRALYIARAKDMAAYGYAADRRRYVHLNYYRFREFFARVKAFADVLSGRNPKFLGKKIPVEGDGRKSWDEDR